jgi:hypothetical protein
MIEIVRAIRNLQEQVEEIIHRMPPRVVILAAKLTSTSWDGDEHRSDTAKTIIDMSAVFSGYPSGARAVLVEAAIQDSGSAAGVPYMVLGYSDTANEGTGFGCIGVTNDAWVYHQKWVPCDANGDIYFQIEATGASTFEVILEVRGWLL